MSYCRWQHPGCDLYCYADVKGGYTTHITDHERVSHIEHHGATFRDVTLADFKRRLQQLRYLGYEAPFEEIFAELGGDGGVPA